MLYIQQVVMLPHAVAHVRGGPIKVQGTPNQRGSPQVQQKTRELKKSTTATATATSRNRSYKK